MRYAVCHSTHNSDHTTTLAEDQPVESSRDLAFFESRDVGTYDATEICKCHYARVAHIPNETHRCTRYCRHCNNFKPHGPYEYDSYYCGHSGWD